jgi:hypothetical protein
MDMMSYLQETNTSSVCHQIIFNAFHDAKGVEFILCNSVEELESKTISALCEEMSFFAVGPIFPSRFTKSFIPTSLWFELNCNQWLNNKYVSFGSYAHTTKRDLVEIANGLSLSKVNFV